MAEEDIIIMSQKELKKSHIVAGVVNGEYQQVDAAEMLGISTRQVRRLEQRFKENGERGLMHGLRGRESNHAYGEGFRNKVLGICEDRYSDFGPKFAAEKLLEVEKIRIHFETLRLWMLKKKKERVWQRTGRKHRKKRERKHWYGAMIQMDGSHHDWLEGRGPWLVLMGYIDDATGKVHARFYNYEGTIPAMDSFKRYIRKNGIPQSIYFDRHTTYKSTQKQSIEDELLNREALSQFGRALRELGVEFIHANSPQAKGRVERLFKTFQDRLVKEMRLAGIKTLEGANTFLEIYLTKFNKHFSVQALEKGNLHRKVPQGLKLDNTLCIKTERVLRNDFTIMYEKKFYQVLEGTRARKVIVEEHINGKLHITYNGTYLKYKEIADRCIAVPRQKKCVSVDRSVAIQKYVPSKEHPWRRFVINPDKHRLDIAAKEKEAKRNKWKELINVVDTAAHVEIDGQHDTACVAHNYHNRLNNSKKTELFTVPTTLRLGVFHKQQKPDISTLVKSGHF
jgi:hypothetical protein